MEQTEGKSQLSFSACIELAAEKMQAAGLFFGHGTDNAYDEAVWLVCYGLGLSEFEIEECADKLLTSEQMAQVENWLDQRIEQRRPVAYILGKAWFCGIEFIVNENVLIPRSPIAELIQEQYQTFLPEKENYRILDLCCGSGCIGLASAAHLPNSFVDLADISEEALSVAKENQAYVDLCDRSALIESDLFDSIPRENQYDLIVSNPPYVDAQDLLSMPEEYHHEPSLGLAAGNDGLDLLRRILHEATHYLKEDGVLIVEVGNSAKHVEALYPQVPFTWIEFAYGGEGVFLLDHATIKENIKHFNL